MSRRRNAYHRRRVQRRSDRIFVLSFFATCCLFGALYLIFRSQIMTAVYQEILATPQPHSKTVDSVLFTHLLNYLPLCFVVLVILMFVFGLLLPIQHDSFDFGEVESFAIRPVFTKEDFVRSKNLYRLSSRQFEEQVARLITMQTGKRTVVIGGSGDQGADIAVYDDQNRRIGIVQCKKHNPHKALDPSFVREMPSVARLYQVNIVYLATTAYFSMATRQIAGELGVKLIDGHDLKQISRKVASGKLQQKNTVSTAAPSQTYTFTSQNDLHAAYRPPLEQDRIQEQLRQRRDKLSRR